MHLQQPDELGKDSGCVHAVVQRIVEQLAELEKPYVLGRQFRCRARPPAAAVITHETHLAFRSDLYF